MTIKFIGNKYAPLNEDKNGILSTTVDYIYYFNNAESPLDIFAESTIPVRGSQYPGGGNLYALNRTVSAPQEGDEAKSGKYTVSVVYTNDLRQDITIQARSRTIAPWRLPPYDIRIFPIDITVPFVKAFDTGDPPDSPSIAVLNPVGDPYEAVTVKQHTIIRFSYNLRNFRGSWIDRYSDTVNRSSVTVVRQAIPAKKGRMRNLVSGVQKIYDDEGSLLYKYVKVDVEIEKAVDVWKQEIMRRGLYFIDTGKKYRIYTDNDGIFGKKGNMGTDATAVDEPQRLDENGALYSGDSAEYDTFFDKAFISWRSLNLPKTME